MLIYSLNVSILFFISRLNFTVFATNGGYVSVYDRENNSRIDRYDVSGKTESNVFEIRFDTEEPDHCMIENLNCISQPLVVPDVTTQVLLLGALAYFCILITHNDSNYVFLKIYTKLSVCGYSVSSMT